MDLQNSNLAISLNNKLIALKKDLDDTIDFFEQLIKKEVDISSCLKKYLVTLNQCKNILLGSDLKSKLIVLKMDIITLTFDNLYRLKPSVFV